MRKTQVTVGERRALVKNPLIVDGISRAGKFLLANLLSGIAGVEPVQHRPALELVARLPRFGLIDTSSARELLRAEADMAQYDMLLGRSINFRKSDKSCVYNNASPGTYIKRLHSDGAEYHNRNSLFIVHETLPNIKVFFDAFPDIKLIVLQRSPVDLVYSWHQRKLIYRVGKDPLMGEIPVKGKKDPLPWYLYNRQQEYASLSGIDRTILAICTLFDMYEKASLKLAPKDKKRTLFVRYEHLILNPESEVKTISRFLRRKTLPGLARVIKKEKLPNKKLLGLTEHKSREIRVQASQRYFDRLMLLEEKYSGSMYAKTTHS